MKKQVKDIIIAGFALFAMFLGAGNLIFPPSLGAEAGTNWFISLLGFLVTGVGFPILGVISMTLSHGEVEKFTKDLPPWFSTALVSIILLIIGPLFVIPRTAATTFEIGIEPVFQNILSPSGISFIGIISRLLFFIITLLLVLTPNNIIEKIGKFLTPTLLIVLALVIGKGIITPIGTPEPVAETNFFLGGFREGYQTMDALGSILLAIIVIESMIAKGYEGRKTLFRMTSIVGLIGCLGLALVYTGLAYLGASSNSVLSESLSRPERLIQVVNLLWGNWGKTLLGLSIGFACITTASGLTAIGGEYFSEKLKTSYKAVVVIILTTSFFISIIGVAGIISFAGPVLEIVYPVVIALIFINFFSNKLPNSWFTRGAIIGTLVVSFSLGIISLQEFFNSTLGMAVDFTHAKNFFDNLPLASIGFSWLIPAVIVGLLCGFSSMLKSNLNKKTK